MGILVIDVGTSGLRATVVEPDATLHHERRRRLPPSTPFPGLVEFDPVALADTAVELAAAVLAEVGRVEAVAVTNQRASTVVWDASDGQPVGPGLGWQDLRTAGDCLALQAEGLRLAPNQSATKLTHLLGLAAGAAADGAAAGAGAAAPPPERLRFGTIDTWLAWRLTEGAAHVTDRSNAGVTGLVEGDGSDWSRSVVEQLRIPPAVLPTIVDSAEVVGDASVLPGAPPLAGRIGDQQASLFGQGCARPGLAKVTVGTGAMLDVYLGDTRPAFETRGPQGTFPIVALGQDGGPRWGLEAILLAAGSNVDWLRDDLGLIATAAESHELAAAVDDSDGVVYVPHLLGEGTPGWDLGARGTLVGVTRGTDRRHLCRAVLDGVAHAVADLVEAAEADGELRLDRLRLDGGVSANPTFVQCLADAAGRPVEVSPQLEATALGAGLVAGLGLGWFSGLDDLAETWSPARVVEPSAAAAGARGEFRERWAAARERAARWYPELSDLSF